MDWNNDGKHDWKDDSVYNNVVSDGNNRKNNSSNKGDNSSSSSGIVCFIAICVIYLFIKIFT